MVTVKQTDKMCFSVVLGDIISLAVYLVTVSTPSFYLGLSALHFVILAEAPLVVGRVWNCHLSFFFSSLFLLLLLLNVPARLSAHIWNESVALSLVFIASVELWLHINMDPSHLKLPFTFVDSTFVSTVSLITNGAAVRLAECSGVFQKIVEWQ